MLRQTILNANPQIASSVEKLIDEERRRERSERRSASRTPFTAPVLIRFRDQTESIVAISKDISIQGIGLITDQDFAPGATAKLELRSPYGPPQIFLSELRWRTELGHSWYISGWHFVTLVRN